MNHGANLHERDGFARGGAGGELHERFGSAEAFPLGESRVPQIPAGPVSNFTGEQRSVGVQLLACLGDASLLDQQRVVIQVLHECNIGRQGVCGAQDRLKRRVEDSLGGGHAYIVPDSNANGKNERNFFEKTLRHRSSSQDCYFFAA